MKMTVQLRLVLVFLLSLQPLEAKGRWRPDMEPVEANRYSCAKFLKNALYFPPSKRWSLEEVQSLQVKSRKWFERRRVHQELSQDPSFQGQRYRTSLETLYDAPELKERISLMQWAMRIRFYCVNNHLPLPTVEEWLDALERMEKGENPPLKDWTAEGTEKLKSLWERWNWRPYGE